MNYKPSKFCLELESIYKEIYNCCEYKYPSSYNIYLKKNQYKTIKSLWYKFFSVALKKYGFNKRAIDELFKWGNSGHNWKELWQENSIDYKNYGEILLLRAFIYEIEYIYDRVSLDRLFRTHWIFNQYSYKRKKNHK